MSSLALVPENPVEQLDLVKRTVAKGATDDELKLFLYDCQRRNVHPLDKLIHFTVRVDSNGKRTYTPITSIDFMRSQASDSGEYAGNDDAEFPEVDDKGPLSAKVTVYRLVQGHRCPFTATARWVEYYPGEKLGFMWRKMPFVMLGKCAEALALRKAFPRQLAGLYAREEMDQAGQQEPKFDKETYVEHKLAELKGETVKSLPKDAVEFAWRERLKNCSTPEQFNEALPDMASLPATQKTTVKKILVERANACGLAWDKAKSEFYDPDAKPDVKAMLDASLAACDAEDQRKATEAPESQPEAKKDITKQTMGQAIEGTLIPEEDKVEVLPKDCERFTGILTGKDNLKGKFGTGTLSFDYEGDAIAMPFSVWDKKLRERVVDAYEKEVSAVIKRTEKGDQVYHNLISFELTGLFA